LTVVPQPLVPAGIASITGLVADGAIVWVGPPFACSGPSWGSTPFLSVAAPHHAEEDARSSRHGRVVISRRPGYVIVPMAAPRRCGRIRLPGA
jgi:hypothetical protein